jgi:hypothetical protein
VVILVIYTFKKCDRAGMLFCVDHTGLDQMASNGGMIVLVLLV